MKNKPTKKSLSKGRQGDILTQYQIFKKLIYIFPFSFSDYMSITGLEKG